MQVRLMGIFLHIQNHFHKYKLQMMKPNLLVIKQYFQINHINLNDILDNIFNLK